jgi:hypothetical protein
LAALLKSQVIPQLKVPDTASTNTPDTVTDIADGVLPIPLFPASPVRGYTVRLPAVSVISKKTVSDPEKVVVEITANIPPTK